MRRVERDLHRWEEGARRDAEFLRGQYYDLNRNIMAPAWPASAIGHDGAIPHFTTLFYVYKYATAYCAALVFARRLRAGAGVEAYSAAGAAAARSPRRLAAAAWSCATRRPARGLRRFGAVHEEL